MDQEKFDQHLMDFLFDELDEVTAAAMRRKIDADADARELEAGLRATIEVAQLPVEQPSDDLEDRILAAARLAEQGEPLHRKLLRSLAWAGSHAMRPQLAMAAILMLVLGSSVLLLRARPGAVVVSKDDAPPPAASSEPAANPLELTAPEEVPSATPQPQKQVAVPAAVASASASALANLDATYDEALKAYSTGDFGAARRGFATVAASRSPKAGSAKLYEARSVRSTDGCGPAIPIYQAVRQRGGGSALGLEASWDLADCLTQVGRKSEAMAVLRQLAQVQAYAQRANAQLERMGEATSTGGNAVASKRRAMEANPAPAPAAPPPQAKPAAPPPSTTSADAFEEAL